MPEETLDPREAEIDDSPAGEADSAQVPEQVPDRAPPARQDEIDEPAAIAEQEEPAEEEAEETEEPDEEEGEEEAEAIGELDEEGGGQQQDQEEPQPEYGVEVEDVGTLKKKVTVTIPAAMIEAKREEMFGELHTTAQVPGFRIGRAPRRLLEKRFGKEVARDVRNALLGESLGSALEKTDLRPVGEPDLDLDEIELPETGDLTYGFEIEVAPEFELPELEGIEVRRVVPEVTPQRIDEALERLRLREGRYEPTDGPAQAQDTVVAAAKVGGEGIEEAASTVTLRVAPGQIEGLPIVDLGDRLAGKRGGERVSLTVKVPAVHPTESWRGKDATVELTINEVRRRVLPEVDEEYARAHGYDSLEEMREAIGIRMRLQIESEARQAMREQVQQHLLENTDFELPPEAAARHAEQMLQRRYVELLQAGIGREQIDERLTELQASVAEQARRDLKLTFLLRRIAEDREIQVAAEEINARVAQIAQLQGRRPERLRHELEAEGALGVLEAAVRDEKVLNAILAQARIVEATGGAEPGEADAPRAAEEDDKPGAEDAAQGPTEQGPTE